MRVMKELRALTAKPPEGIRVYINEDNISTVVADIDGPVGTPFEGGVFRCKLALGADFPNAPPKGVFTTKLFHPNVSAAGEICVNTLKKDWQPTLGLGHVLLVIRCLLIDPNPASALNEEAGKLLNEDYDSFFKRAQLMTKIHATKGGAAAAAAGAGSAPAAPKPAVAAPAANANAGAEKANTKAADGPAETKNPVIAKDNKENAAAAAAAVNAAKKPAPAAAGAAAPKPVVAPGAAAAGTKPAAAAAAASTAAANAAAAKKKALKRL